MKRRSIQIFLALIAGLMIFLGDALVLCAQETKSDEFTLEEITVTAQKRETNLQKTPISIQAVAGEELVTEAKVRIDEIMQGVVGVQTQGSQVGVNFFMRGLGNAEGNGPAGGQQQSAVAILIDGVYQNRGEVVRGGTVDMARAEVMRGTQSTTLGGSSLAGAVSMVSNNPVFKYEGSGALGFGDYNLLSTQAVLNVPLADNQALRLAYSTEKRDGYISNNAGNSDQSNGRIKYRWQPTEDFDLVATASKQVIGGNGVDVNSLSYYGYWEGYDPLKDRTKTPGCTTCYDATMGYPVLYGHINNGVKYDKRDNPWDDGMPSEAWPNDVFRHTNIYQFSTEINWKLGIGTLTLVPSYQTAKFTSQESPRGSQNDSETWNAEKRNQETKQVDMRLASPADSPFEWLAGLYYYDTESSGVMYSANINSNQPGDGRYNPALPPTYYDWESTDPSSQKTYAAYGNFSYPVLDVLRINGGLRYTKDEKVERKTSSRLVGFMEPASSAFVYGPASKGKWHDVTYRIGGEYDLSQNIMGYALYATGYQPGQFTMSGQTDAQKLKQYTVGLKSRWLDKRLQLNVEGFQSTYFNRDFRGSLQVFSPDFINVAGRSTCGNGPPTGPPGTPVTDIANNGSYYCADISGGATIPKLVSQGVDVEINYLITENDRIDLSGEYLKSTQTKPDTNVSLAFFEGLPNINLINGGAQAFMNGLNAVAASYDGLTLQNSPEWSANFSYSHMFVFASGSTLTPKINIEYKDTYYSSGGGPAAASPDPAEAYQDAYELYNFYLNWNSADGKFNINAYVKNIQNTPVLTNYGPEGMNSVTLLPPRTFGMVFSVKF
jgi:iron complex outermembrane recepter protein